MAYVLLQCNITAVDRAYDDPDQETVEQHADQGKDDEGDELDFFCSCLLSAQRQI